MTHRRRPDPGRAALWAAAAMVTATVAALWLIATVGR
jgi:hypothetical protein